MRSTTSIDPATAHEIEALAAGLEERVLAERAAPRAEWRRELDGRVAAGFPRRRRRLPRAGIRVWAPALGLGAAAMLALVVVVTGGLRREGAGAPGGGGGATLSAPAGDREGSAGAAAGGPGVADARSSAGRAAGGAAPGPAAVPPPDRPRRVRRATQLFLAVPGRRMQATAQRVVSTSAAFGGVVLTSTVASGGAPDATFELRFPADRVDRAVARLASLGRVRSQTSTSRDVTRGFLTAREELDGARAERAGLLRALGRADTRIEIDALKRRLRLADERVRAARGVLARIRSSADFSRVDLQVSAERGGAAPAPGAGDPWSPGDALHDAGRILAVAAGIGVLALACALPVAIVAALGALGVAGLRRRRREAALA